MRSEHDKMLAGELYHPLDPQLAAERRRARLLFNALNGTRDDQQEERARLIKALIPALGRDIWIEPPFDCDDGSHMTLGDKVFFNGNCVVLDVAPVRIGSGVLIGPAVQISAATHPLRAVKRRTGLEYGRPVEIGDEVWVGGGADGGGQCGDEGHAGRGVRGGPSLPNRPRDRSLAQTCRVVRRPVSPRHGESAGEMTRTWLHINV
jgi:maltose O-acetyltransferase